MAVPSHNLTRAHKILLAKGYAPRMEVQPGYRAVLCAGNVEA